MAKQGGPSAGDFTGRQKEQQGREAMLAQQERAAEVSMMTATEEEQQAHGVFDPRTGQRIGENDGDPNSAIVIDAPPERGGYFRQSEEPVFSGQEPDEVVAPALAARKAFTQPPVQVLTAPYVKIRVETDIEKMTYGMENGEPRNFTFREGLTYEVPRDVAEHLNERGQIRQWVG